MIFDLLLMLAEIAMEMYDTLANEALTHMVRDAVTILNGNVV